MGKALIVTFLWADGVGLCIWTEPPYFPSLRGEDPSAAEGWRLQNSAHIGPGCLLHPLPREMQPQRIQKTTTTSAIFYDEWMSDRKWVGNRAEVFLQIGCTCTGNQGRQMERFRVLFRNGNLSWHRGAHSCCNGKCWCVRSRSKMNEINNKTLRDTICT